MLCPLGAGNLRKAFYSFSWRLGCCQALSEMAACRLRNFMGFGVQVSGPLLVFLGLLFGMTPKPSCPTRSVHCFWSFVLCAGWSPPTHLATRPSTACIEERPEEPANVLRITPVACGIVLLLLLLSPGSDQNRSRDHNRSPELGPFSRDRIVLASQNRSRRPQSFSRAIILLFFSELRAAGPERFRSEWGE